MTFTNHFISKITCLCVYYIYAGRVNNEYDTDKMDTRRNAPEEPDKVETIPNCITTKESSGFNVYAAMNGYDKDVIGNKTK